MDLKLSSYDYELPSELIAQRPCERRGDSRLLVYNHRSGEIIHTVFSKLTIFLPENSLTIFNESKVVPARLIGKKASGGKCELFILKLFSVDGCYEVLIGAGGKKKIGDRFLFDHGLKATIQNIYDGSFGVIFNRENISEYLQAYGKIPIPPYIRGGESDQQDRSDYQTLYAKNDGSVAAPTAGLHFTEKILAELDKAYVNLHVGLGTFAPVKADNLCEHKMHCEEYFVNDENLQKIRKAKESGRKVTAVGTTSLRVLESFWDKKWPLANELQETEIFLHPGIEIKSIDALITNFHLPKSTLLMLVSSLISREKTLELYTEAIREHYRFFSYGDAMLILR